MTNTHITESISKPFSQSSRPIHVICHQDRLYSSQTGWHYKLWTVQSLHIVGYILLFPLLPDDRQPKKAEDSDT